MNRMLASRESAPFVGFLAAMISTAIATIVLFPDQPAPRGALFLPALVMTIGIMFVPAVHLFSGSRDLTNAENFVCLGYVFWLLLDLLQGAYDLRDATEWGLRLALGSIGLSAAFMWIGMAGREWKAPAWLATVARQQLETRTINRLIPICFALGMLNFAEHRDALKQGQPSKLRIRP